MTPRQQIEGALKQAEQEAFERGVRESLRHFERVVTWVRSTPEQLNPEEYARKVLHWIGVEEQEIREKYPFA